MPRASYTTLGCLLLLAAAPLVFAEENVQNAPPGGAIQPARCEATIGCSALSEMQAERDRLFLENQLREERLRKELAASTTELQRIKTEVDLNRAKADQAMAIRSVEIQKARQEMDEINTRVALETARIQQNMEKELAELRAKRERAEIESQVAIAEFTRQSNAFKTQELQWTTRLAELRAKVNERESETEADAYVDEKPVYSKDPVQENGDLVISDRRIALNGPITSDTADFVCARIDFFNNKNKEYPIFIVIDDSPGGSVMAGYKILKSMHSSTAPVYVVVKSYAASMAAAICTLAQKSFAYPNAIIVHHQISNGIRGNLAAQRESVKTLEQWWDRLATPIAQKMGVSLDEFSKLMYEHSVSGDWQEFADNAVKLKWVDVVVGRCRETGMVKNPDKEPPVRGAYAANVLGQADLAGVKADARAVRGVVLPRLNPLDCYYLYDPEGIYRTE